MNNTANVLLKSPVSASTAAAPKRDYQSNDSSVDFNQTLKGVNDGLNRRNERVQESANNKKSEQFERQRDLKDKAVKDRDVKDRAVKDSADLQKSNNAKKAKEASLADEAAHAKRNSSNDKTQLRELSVDKKHSVNKLADAQPREELNQDALNLDAKVDIPAQDAALNAIGVVSAVGVVSTIDEATPSTISAETDASDISTTPSDSEQAMLDSSLLNSLNENGVNLQAQALAESVDAASSQPLNPVAPADAQILAASLAPVKPLEPQVAVGDAPKEAAGVLASLAAGYSSSKSAPTNPNAAPADANAETGDSEITTAQAQMQASKSAFEKALQTIVSPESAAADEVAAPVSNSGNSSSSTHQPMDSFMRATETPAARSFVIQTAVPVPVGQPQWSQAVGEKVLWLAAQNVSSAEINLHPKDLGPMQVKVSVNQEQATVSFTSQHAVVREVLDQNLNRLRDMFSEQGLNLVNVDVSDKSFSRQHGDAQSQKGQSGTQSLAHEEETPVAMSTIVQQRLVDHYA
jgi:flagellar hook-length control protein FliK